MASAKTPTRFVVVDDEEEILQIWRRVLATEDNCICFLTTDPQEALKEIEINGCDFLITDVVMPMANGFELAHKALEICPSLQIFYTTGSVALVEELSEYPQAERRLRSVPAKKMSTENSELPRSGAWEDMFEVLQKPYSDLHNIQEFIHDLATHQPLDRSHCTEKGHLRLWNL
jgi:two-component system cell cycle response regulator CpdR